MQPTKLLYLLGQIQLALAGLLLGLSAGAHHDEQPRASLRAHASYLLGTSIIFFILSVFQPWLPETLSLHAFLRDQIRDRLVRIPWPLNRLSRLEALRPTHLVFVTLEAVMVGLGVTGCIWGWVEDGQDGPRGSREWRTAQNVLVAESVFLTLTLFFATQLPQTVFADSGYIELPTHGNSLFAAYDEEEQPAEGGHSHHFSTLHQSRSYHDARGHKVRGNVGVVLGTWKGKKEASASGKEEKHGHERWSWFHAKDRGVGLSDAESEYDSDGSDHSHVSRVSQRLQKAEDKLKSVFNGVEGGHSNEHKVKEEPKRKAQGGIEGLLHPHSGSGSRTPDSGSKRGRDSSEHERHSRSSRPSSASSKRSHGSRRSHSSGRREQGLVAEVEDEASKLAGVLHRQRSPPHSRSPSPAPKEEQHEHVGVLHAVLHPNEAKDKASVSAETTAPPDVKVTVAAKEGKFKEGVFHFMKDAVDGEENKLEGEEGQVTTAGGKQEEEESQGKVEKKEEQGGGGLLREILHHHDHDAQSAEDVKGAASSAQPAHAALDAKAAELEGREEEGAKREEGRQEDGDGGLERFLHRHTHEGHPHESASRNGN